MLVESVTTSCLCFIAIILVYNMIQMKLPEVTSEGSGTMFASWAPVTWRRDPCFENELMRSNCIYRMTWKETQILVKCIDKVQQDGETVAEKVYKSATIVFANKLATYHCV